MYINTGFNLQFLPPSLLFKELLKQFAFLEFYYLQCISCLFFFKTRKPPSPIRQNDYFLQGFKDPVSTAINAACERKGKQQPLEKESSEHQHGEHKGMK